MKRKHWKAVFQGMLVAGLILCVSSPVVYGQGNISLGRLAVHPGITYKIDVWDNIYSANTGEVDDVLHKFTPKISLDYKGEPGNYFNAKYEVDLVAYSDYDENNYQTHKPSVSFGYKSPQGFYLQASESYVDTANPYGSANDYNIGERTERQTNDFKVRVGYEFEFVGVEVMYGNSIIDYELLKDQWEDKTGNTFEVSLFYNFSPKTSLFGQFRRVNNEYDSQNDGVAGWTSDTSQDNDVSSFFLGARFKPGGKLSGDIKFGWGDKKFANVVDKDGNEYEDPDSVVAETNLRYKMSEKTSLSIRLTRAHKGSPDEFDEDGNSYIDTVFGVTLNQKLGSRLAAQLSGSWNNQDYDKMPAGAATKEYNKLDFVAGLTYSIQDWLKAGAQYRFNNREADSAAYKGKEFDSNTFTVSVSALF